MGVFKITRITWLCNEYVYWMLWTVISRWNYIHSVSINIEFAYSSIDEHGIRQRKLAVTLYIMNIPERVKYRPYVMKLYYLKHHDVIQTIIAVKKQPSDHLFAVTHPGISVLSFSPKLKISILVAWLRNKNRVLSHRVKIYIVRKRTFEDEALTWITSVYNNKSDQLMTDIPSVSNKLRLVLCGQSYLRSFTTSNKLCIKAGIKGKIFTFRSFDKKLSWRSHYTEMYIVWNDLFRTEPVYTVCHSILSDT